MDISVKTTLAPSHRTACLVVPVFERRRLSAPALQLDAAADGHLTALLKQGDMDGKAGQSLMLHGIRGITAPRLLLVGCGKEKDFDTRGFRNAVATAIKALRDSGARDATSYLAEPEIRDVGFAQRLRLEAETALHASYRFDQLKSRKKPAEPPLRKLILNVGEAGNLANARLAVRIGTAVGKGVATARDLGNLPGNICTPAYLARTAQQNAKRYASMKVRVLKQKDMEQLGMGALLSVARGSRQPPRFIVVEYQGGKKGDKPVVLVGKGITFDSGGISIKPSQAMDEMKFDMCGAASVLGTLVTLGELQLPINVVGIVPSCENMPDGAANKPGDIVTSMSGQTIEVLNTDAEGRLILCDALTYAERFKPRAVIDIATLTGACVIALGKHPSGLLSNDETLADRLREAGQRSDDRVWPLPLWEEYQDQLKSNFADMANIGGREAGTITAACFLARFTEKYKWAHLDIAG
ncbi:MAG TPA: leucyl aminopeptidase, partial [Chromatiales bacterium]|nr:leucyl aminopeptidase [Chromatiales bacterium]